MSSSGSVDAFLRDKVIGISASESSDLLGRGFGFEHIQEVVLAIAQRLLRHGANLAYGGHYGPQSLTRHLIELIGDEQTEGVGEDDSWIGILYNHSPWPHCDEITDDEIAETIDACQFLRIDQEVARIDPAHRIPKPYDGDRSRLNQAIVLSAMRRKMAEGMTGPDGAAVRPLHARVIIGGKLRDFTGVMPGLYEECVYCLENGIPVYLIGGFGGAAMSLGKYLAGGSAKASMLSKKAMFAENPGLEELERSMQELEYPADFRSPTEALTALKAQLDSVRENDMDLGNGLTKAENRQLFRSNNTIEITELIVAGLGRLQEAG